MDEGRCMAGEERRDCKEEEEEAACRLTDGSREKPFPSHASHEVVAPPLRTKNEREEMENCRAVFGAKSSYFSSWTDSTASSVLQSRNFHSFSLSPSSSVSRHFAFTISLDFLSSIRLFWESCLLYTLTGVGRATHPPFRNVPTL